MYEFTESSVCQPCCYIHTHVCLSIGLLALELLSQFSYSLCLLCGWTLTQNRVIILCIMNALHQCLCLNRGLSNNLVVYCKLITNDAKFFIYQWCIGFVIMNFPRLEFYYSIKKSDNIRIYYSRLLKEQILFMYLDWACRLVWLSFLNKKRRNNHLVGQNWAN